MESMEIVSLSRREASTGSGSVQASNQQRREPDEAAHLVYELSGELYGAGDVEARSRATNVPKVAEFEACGRKVQRK